MKISFESRKWHLWVSLILALPIVIVAVTAVFIAHHKALDLRAIPVAAGWLPGYSSAAAHKARLEPRASLLSSAGVHWVGTNDGLYRVDQGRLVMVDLLAGTPVRALVEAPWGLVAATRTGLWVGRDGNWLRTHKGDAWNASVRADGAVAAAVKDEGLLVSVDGRAWQSDPELTPVLAASLAEGEIEVITLSKLVMDLHTGKALVGKDWEWIWIDLVGLAMTLLALTGVYMWWRGERRKAALAQAMTAKAAAAAHTATDLAAPAQRATPAA